MDLWGRLSNPIQRRLSPTDIGELIAAYLAGARINELADRYGLHRTTVAAALDRHHVERHRTVPFPTKNVPPSPSSLLSTSDQLNPGNPITNWYRTGDGRWLYLVCLQAGRFWAEVCQVVGRPDLATDPRFAEFRDLIANRREAVAELDAAFAERTLNEWKDAFAGFSGVWAACAVTARGTSPSPS